MRPLGLDGRAILRRVDVDLTVTAGNYRFDGVSFAVDTFSSRSTLVDSLGRLMVLPEETVVHPGHGYVTDIGAERLALGQADVLDGG